MFDPISGSAVFTLALRRSAKVLALHANRMRKTKYASRAAAD
jgi:hypothetical protein